MEEAKKFCPECGTMSSRHIDHRIETHVVRGDTIAIPAAVAVCTNCFQDVGDVARDDATLQRVYNVYRERHDILTPAQIRSLREVSNLSQRGFGRLLGWGEITVHRYETGALPDKAHNAQMVALQDEDALFRFIQRRLDHLQEGDRYLVREAMERRLPAVATAEIEHGIEHLINAHPDISRGNRSFSLKRFGQMVVYFTSQRVQPTRVKLLKLLWYADFLRYKRGGCSLSGAAYVHYPLGPVPDQYDRLIGECRGSGLILSESLDYVTHDGVQTGFKYQALVPFQDWLFTSEEIDVLVTVHEYFEAYTAKQIKEASHRETAWQETSDKQVIPYSYACDLHLD